MQKGQNLDAKKPQLPEDHAQVVAGTAEHGMERIAQAAAEPVAAQQSFILHVPDHRFDGTGPFDVLLEPARDTAPHAAAPNLHSGHVGALIALVGKDSLRFLLREDLYLLDGFGQRVPTKGIARQAAHAHDQTFPVRRRDRGLDAKLVGLPGFALGNAFNFRGVQAVKLVLVFRACSRSFE